jgi:NOL1/NOP2/fmu family ribosome biogenesis protein
MVFLEGMAILNSKEKKEFYAKLKEQWDIEFHTEHGLLKNSEDKIYFMNNALSSIDPSKLRINCLGLYIAEWKKHSLRLSIEGSQLLGPLAQSNVIEITKEETGKWLMGEDLRTNESVRGYALIKCGNDFLGSGHVKEGIITNFVGKNRRTSAVHE